MKICCISDLHGRLPRVLPDHDLLLIAGDICPLENHNELYQKMWLSTVFQAWWENIDSPRGYGCWGNHDLVAEKRGESIRTFKSKGRELTIAADAHADVDGLDLYMFAYQLTFSKGWAFNRNEEQLEGIYNRMPKADIIVNHGPPYGFGDYAKRFKAPGYELTGSKSLFAAAERSGARLLVCGHIHNGYGLYNHGNMKIVNASILDNHYKIANDPIVVEI